MLGGLALGGLLGALFFGGAFENLNFLDIAIFALIGFLLYRLFAARARRAMSHAGGGSQPAGASASNSKCSSALGFRGSGHGDCGAKLTFGVRPTQKSRHPTSNGV